MAKEKKQKQINLEEITALTKELFHAHYAGDLERWFDYLCPDSIYPVSYTHLTLPTILLV